jgi:hypothetical protein
VQAMLSMPLEDEHQKSLETVRNTLRDLLREWLSEKAVQEEVAAPSATPVLAGSGTVNIDELPPEVRARVIGRINAADQSVESAKKKSRTAKDA